MTAFVTDTFTDVDLTALTDHTPELGGPISAHPAGGTSGKIKGNEAVSDGATLSFYYYGATPPSANYQVSATFRVHSIVSLDQPTLFVRLDPSALTGYEFQWSANSSAWRLIKVVAGASTVLGTFSNTPTVASHTVLVTIIGTHIVCAIDGVVRITADDTSSKITAAGKVGIGVRKSDTASHGIAIDSLSATPAAPINTVVPALSGSVLIGSALSCDGGTWADDGTGTRTYQWQRSHLGTLWGNIAGATSSSYTLTSSDDGMLVRCVVTDTDGVGATSANSAASASVRAPITAGIRSWPRPQAGSETLHFLGDIHFGATSSVRTNKVLADLSHPLVPTPLAHFQIGDQDENGISSQDTTAKAWLAQITDAPVYALVGNHDLYNESDSTVRAVSAWETAYAAYLPSGSKNYVVDFSTVRVIAIGTDAASTADRLPISQTTLDWLAARLDETELDCWIACHFPLNNTVLNSDTTNYWSSDLSGIGVWGPNQTDDTEIRAVLAAHGNAKAWIAGHSHSPISDTGFAALTKCGSRLVAAINTSSINWEGRIQEWNDPFHSVYLTRLPSGDIEVRYRDHGAGVWAAPYSARVTVLSPN